MAPHRLIGRQSVLQQRDGRWAIVDIVGKGNRVRTAPMPAWTRVLIDKWALLAGLADGRVLAAEFVDHASAELFIVAGIGAHADEAGPGHG